MASLVSGLIGGIGSLFSGLFGAANAKKAANAEETADQNAQNVVAGNQNQALGIEQGAQTTNAGNEQPFLSAGQNAVGSLSQLLQNGSLTPATFQAPTIDQAQNNPGYKFALQQGEQAMQNSAAASGGLLTGGTAMALNNYAQGAATQNYQQVYNNAVQNYELGLQGQQQQYGQLAGVAGLGLSSAGEIGGVDTSLSGQQANTLGQGGAEQASLIQNAGQAQAAGIVGSTNAFSGGVTAAGSGLSSILQSYGIGGGGGASGYSAPPPAIPYTGSALASGPMNPSYFAGGGHTTAKKPIVVGEEGPELFIPDKSGFVLPHEFLQKGSLKALLAKRNLRRAA